MPERKIKYFDWEYERFDMLNCLEWTVGNYPFLKGMKVPIKAYQIVDHGQKPEEVVDFINASEITSASRLFRARIFEEKNWLAWQTGIGGVFYDRGQPAYFVPMIDMEVISTPNLKQDMKQLERQLKELDMDCSIIRSGDVGRGGYFIVGHEPLLYYPYYWQFLGKVLSVFAVGDGNEAQTARRLGNKLAGAKTQEESCAIADEILKAFHSIKNGQEREGVLCDPRWVGHKVKDGFTILRQTPGKSYEDRPLQVACFD